MAGMTYATSVHLAAYLSNPGLVIDNAERLLLRATELVQEATCGRIAIPADPEAVPADPDNLTGIERAQIACRTAVCAQVEYWLEAGEDPDLRPNVRNYTRGRASTSFGTGGLPELAPRARRVLFLAGELYAGATLK